MELRVWLLALLSLVSSSKYEYRGFDVCNKQLNCAACISSAPSCTWCTDPEEDGNRRCRDLVFEQKCDNLINPQPVGNVANISEGGDLDFGSKTADDKIIQVKPQKLEATIRNASSIEFTVKVQPAKDFPLDLYFVMDLSYSMKDTLDTLKENVAAMRNKLKDLTKDHRIGFGTFVDKTTAPFIYTTKARLKNPCGETRPCEPAYNFNNTVSLNESENFGEFIEASKVSASVDTPEAGMDALMQIAACTDEIGWRKQSRKVIVYLTDTGFHFAGDGKLGGQIERNDGQCWLNGGRTYTKEKIFDYPSIHQVVKKMVDNQMIPIFGVKKEVIDLYNDFKSLYPYGAVGELSKDSVNLVDLIVENYRNISTTISPIIKSLPTSTKLEHEAVCPGAEKGVKGGECKNVGILQEATFKFTVSAEQCFNKSEEIVIEFTGFGLVKLNLTTLCECECGSDGDGDRDRCSGSGVFKCGVCVCDDNFSGEFCQCTGSEKGEYQNCIAPNSDVECSGAGQCVCGSCQCSAEIFGQYCECDNTDCEKGSNGLVCSGNGECECVGGKGAQCKCAEGWTGDNCECTTDTSDCMFNSKVCDGNGKCVCGKCVCNDNNYEGKFCQKCDYCNHCDLYQNCTVCVAGTRTENPRNPDECETCNIAYNVTPFTDDPESKDATNVQICNYESDDGCFYQWFYIPGPSDQTRHQLFVDLEVDCDNAINILWVIIGVILAVVVFGIFIICLWKCITTYKDKQEYKKFVEDMNMTKFASTQSPLYECPITHVNNPIAKKM